MSNLSCCYCLRKGHIGQDCFIFSEPISNSIANSIYNAKPNFGFKNKELIYKLLWQVAQEKKCMFKIQQIIRLAETNNIKIDLTVDNNMIFRCACYQDDIELAKYLLQQEPKINVRELNDSAFINACWEHYLVGSHKDIISLLLEKEPYVYSYSFETKEKKINNVQEERNARWNVKREVILISSHLRKNNTIIQKLPTDLLRIVVEFLYKK